MKLLQSSLIILTANAYSWEKNKYCDFNQFLVDSDDQLKSKTDCFNFCAKLDAEKNYAVGSDMCCSFEQWEDMTSTCYLYLGGKTETIDKSEYPNDFFTAVVFPHKTFSSGGGGSGGDSGGGSSGGSGGDSGGGSSDGSSDGQREQITPPDYGDLNELKWYSIPIMIGTRYEPGWLAYYLPLYWWF
jgi:hypothetical protein